MTLARCFAQPGKKTPRMWKSSVPAPVQREKASDSALTQQSWPVRVSRQAHQADAHEQLLNRVHQEIDLSLITCHASAAVGVRKASTGKTIVDGEATAGGPSRCRCRPNRALTGVRRPTVSAADFPILGSMTPYLAALDQRRHHRRRPDQAKPASSSVAPTARAPWSPRDFSKMGIGDGGLQPQCRLDGLRGSVC